MPLELLHKLEPVLSGLGLGLGLLLVVLVLLPANERRLVRGPLILLAVYAGARVAMTFVPPSQFPVKVFHFVAVFAWCAAVVRCLFILFASARLSRFIGRPWPKIVRDVVQAILYVVIALIALRAIGLEPGQLLTTSALLTAVLGLSMQDTLGNLFAGLAVQGQQTVAVGDWVRFGEGEEGLGEVTEINWRATHFMTNTRVQVIVPNGVLARAIIKNYSRPTRLVRHDVEMILPYSASPERVRSLVTSNLRGVDGIVPEPEPHVLISRFSDAGVVYSVRYFINEYGRRDPIESAVRQRVFYAFRRAQIPLPVPHRAIHLATGHQDALAHGVYSEPPPPEDKTDVVERLRRFDLFKGLTPNELETLAADARVALYAPGEAIVRQGDTGADLFALERGRVEVVASVDGRPPARVAIAEAGTVFGELALLSGERRTATVQALAECEVVAVPRAAFKQVIDKNPALTERLTARLAERMEQLNQAVAAGTSGEADDDRRSDILIQRIRKFFAG